MTRRLHAALAAVVVVLATTGCAAVGGPASDRTTGVPTPADAPLIVALGNSFVGGSLIDSGDQSRWPALVGAAVGARVDVIAADASGYLQPGWGGVTYLDLASEVPADAAVVIVMGSDDDDGRTEADIRAAAVETLDRIRERAPQATLIVVSTPWVEQDPREGIVITRNAVRSAAADVGAEFVDSLAAAWLVSGPPGQIGFDGLHPTDEGHAEIAEDLVAPVRNALAGR